MNLVQLLIVGCFFLFETMDVETKRIVWTLLDPGSDDVGLTLGHQFNEASMRDITSSRGYEAKSS